MTSGNTFTIHRVPVDKHGYDNMGCYWGVDQQLWYAISLDAQVDRYFRAADRDSAKQTLKLMFHGCRIMR